MRWIRDRLVLAAMFALAAIVGTSVAAALAYASANRLVDHTMDVRRSANEWTSDVVDAETSALKYVVSASPSALRPLQSARAKEVAHEEQLKALVEDEPLQRERVEATKRDARAVLDYYAELVALVDAGHRDAALARVVRGDGDPLVSAFRTDAGVLRAEQGSLRDAGRAHAAQRAVPMLVAAGLLVLAAIALVAYAATEQRRRAALVDSHAAERRRHLEALSNVASTLSIARSRVDVSTAVVNEGVRAARADTCTLYLLDDSGTKLELVGERRVAKEVVEAVRSISATSGPSRTFASLATGEAMWAENEAEYLRLFPAIASTKTSARRAKAFWSEPLIVEGRPVGRLAMGYYEERTFTAEERGSWRRSPSSARRRSSGPNTSTVRTKQESGSRLRYGASATR